MMLFNNKRCHCFIGCSDSRISDQFCWAIMSFDQMWTRWQLDLSHGPGSPCKRDLPTTAGQLTEQPILGRCYNDCTPRRNGRYGRCSSGTSCFFCTNRQGISCGTNVCSRLLHQLRCPSRCCKLRLALVPKVSQVVEWECR